GRGAGCDPGAGPAGARLRRRARRPNDRRGPARHAPADSLLARRHPRLHPPRLGAAGRRGSGLLHHRRRAAGEGPLRSGRRASGGRRPRDAPRCRARPRVWAGARRGGDRVTETAARAPGKLFVSGEYVVLMGAPAVIAAVDRHAEVRVTRSEKPGPLVVRSLAEGTSWEAPVARNEMPGGDAGAVLAALHAVAERAEVPAHLGTEVVVDSRPFLVGERKLGLGRSSATLVAAVAAFLATRGRPARDGRRTPSSAATRRGWRTPSTVRPTCSSASAPRSTSRSSRPRSAAWWRPRDGWVPWPSPPVPGPATAASRSRRPPPRRRGCGARGRKPGASRWRSP